MGELCLAWSWSILGPISPRVNIPRCGAGNHLLGNEFCFAIDFINQLYREGWANKRQRGNREIINLRFHDLGQKILHGMNKLWSQYKQWISYCGHKKSVFLLTEFNSSDYLVPWCGKRLYLRECTQVTASRSFLWIFDSQPGCSRHSATYWFAQDRARVTSDPRYIFGNAAQDVSGGGRRYIRGNLLVGKTRKIWKGCGWFDWDGDLFTIYYLFSALWTRTSRNPWEMWHRPLSFASLKR